MESAPAPPGPVPSLSASEPLPGESTVPEPPRSSCPQTSRPQPLGFSCVDVCQAQQQLFQRLGVLFRRQTRFLPL